MFLPHLNKELQRTVFTIQSLVAATTMYLLCTRLLHCMMLFTHSEIRSHSIKMTKVVSKSFMLIIVLKILSGFWKISEVMENMEVLGIVHVSKVKNMYHCIKKQGLTVLEKDWSFGL